MMGYGWAPGLGVLWMIGGLLLIVGIVFVVVWAVEALWHGERGVPGSGRVASGQAATRIDAAGSGRPTPDEILRERFARGEVTQAEYEEARRVLGLDR